MRPGNGGGDQLKQAIEGKTSRPSLAVPDEQTTMVCTSILAQ
jgi:hypothetical protein